MSRVVIFGRPGCHLCEQALTVLKRVRTELPFTLEERNIEDDEALLKAYLERIPVVSIDGREQFELFVDEAEFRERLTGRR